MHVVPAVAEDNADRVFAAAKSIGNVVGHVEVALVVAGVGGVEQVAADLPAIEIEFVVTETADVGTRLLDRSVEREGAAEERSGIGVGVSGAGDPLLAPGDWRAQWIAR